MRGGFFGGLALNEYCNLKVTKNLAEEQGEITGLDHA